MFDTRVSIAPSHNQEARLGHFCVDPEKKLQQGQDPSILHDRHPIVPVFQLNAIEMQLQNGVHRNLFMHKRDVRMGGFLCHRSRSCNLKTEQAGSDRIWSDLDPFINFVAGENQTLKGGPKDVL